MNKPKSLFYGDMKDWEVETYKLIIGKAKGIYFSKEAAKYLKHVIDCGTIVDSKEVNEIIDPEGSIPGYIEPGWPYFGKPIKFTGTNPKVSALEACLFCKQLGCQGQCLMEKENNVG